MVAVNSESRLAAEEVGGFAAGVDAGEAAIGIEPEATGQPAGNVEFKAVAAPRLARLRAAAAEAGIRTFFVRDTSNIAWLTAFDDVFDEEQAHALLVTPHDAVLHTDSRYSGAARKAADGEGVIAVDDTRATHGKWVADIFTARHTSASDGASASATDAAPGEAVNPAPAASDSANAAPPAPAAPSEIVLGIEDSMTLSGFRALEGALAKAPAAPQLRETSDFVRALRAVKEPAEVARMKAAQAITDAAFSYICTYIKPGMTERQVQIELEDWMLRHGAAGLAFSSIVASGANGASPHAIPGNKKLVAGECVVMDFGARAHGYCSDMTRTVFIGQPDMKLVHAYTTLREANEQVEAKIKPYVTGAALHQLAEDILAIGGYGGKMGHGLGHGVGIDIHEEPTLSPRNKEPLMVGNVVTVEPGFYVEGEFGMRLEDFGVVTENGFEVFTQSTHEMVIL
jgi:Xaa-Pro aminopeptidase